MKITGTRGICHDSKALHNGHSIQIFLDVETGEAWGRYHVGSGNFTVYDDPKIICCGWLYKPAKMQDIKAIIDSHLEKVGL